MSGSPVLRGKSSVRHQLRQGDTSGISPSRPPGQPHLDFTLHFLPKEVPPCQMNRKYGERQSRNFDDHAVRVPILSVIAAFKVLRSSSKTLLTPLIIQQGSCRSHKFDASENLGYGRMISIRKRELRCAEVTCQYRFGSIMLLYIPGYHERENHEWNRQRGV